MLKHLPGKHNQKLHGRPTGIVKLFGLLKRDGWLVGHQLASKELNDLSIICQPADIEGTSLAFIRLKTKLPANTRYNQYTPKQIDFIRKTLDSLHNAARVAGFEYIEAKADTLPLIAFAKPGYALNDIYGNTVYGQYSLLVKQADKYLEDKYGLEPLSSQDVTKLTDKMYWGVENIGLRVTDFLNIPHPKYPEVPFFREYTLIAYPDPVPDPRYALYNALDELYVKKRL